SSRRSSSSAAVSRPSPAATRNCSTTLSRSSCEARSWPGLMGWPLGPAGDTSPVMASYSRPRQVPATPGRRRPPPTMRPVRAEIGKPGTRAGRDTAIRRTGVALLTVAIIVLALNMRAAITSLPPIFPELHGALHLSAASQSVLAAIPVLCFGVFSGVAAPLSRVFGEERVLGAALVLLAAGLRLRGAAPSILLLPGTVLAGMAIALMNVLLPSLVKRRRPERAGLLIGLYLMALSTGAIVASLIAVPVYQAAGGATGAVR